MARKLHDHYFDLAKREGYRSRAAYKLIEIDDRRRVLRPGAAVLDCGAAPGSWLQVVSARVGPRGLVVGVDLQRIDVPAKATNVRVIEGDVIEVPAAALLEGVPRGAFDAIVSDMAPATTGTPDADHHRSMRLCHALLDRLPDLLRAGGHLVMKAYEGGTYRDLLGGAAAAFETCRGFKPKASRSESREMYVVGKGYRPPRTVAGRSRSS